MDDRLKLFFMEAMAPKAQRALTEKCREQFLFLGMEEVKQIGIGTIPVNALINGYDEYNSST
ncbi:hypothetical protein PsorP6_002365 [Peronosclerospora sorghi]|uniref:Uncharacterized protein n=1 Tax=Peronosclerospora sorghi TaxID=230839 RepID=A0ACC0WTT8_9STRA|nr:hypothetical protein PsorP6_002365 [Peronosclerospora sorghi]